VLGGDDPVADIERRRSLVGVLRRHTAHPLRYWCAPPLAEPGSSGDQSTAEAAR
jgi:hypothetical protein